MDRKTVSLKQTAMIYSRVEQQSKLILSRKTSITWNKNIGLMWNRMLPYSASTATQADQASETPSIQEMLRGIFQKAKKWFLSEQLKPYQDDSQISSLLDQFKNGSLNEQELATEQLRQILSAIQGIARSQVAYEMYSRYGNEMYMEGASNEL